MVGSSFVASPAMASEADCSNYPGTICMAQHYDWTGHIWRQYPSQISGCRRLSGDNFDNKATIVVNNTDGNVGMYLYDNADCSGSNWEYIPSRQIRSFKNDPFNDKASAIRVVYY